MGDAHPVLVPIFFSFLCSFSPKIMPNNSIAGSKGGARDTPPGSKFFHFDAVFDKKIAK